MSVLFKPTSYSVSWKKRNVNAGKPTTVASKSSSCLRHYKLKSSSDISPVQKFVFWKDEDIPSRSCTRKTYKKIIRMLPLSPHSSSTRKCHLGKFVCILCLTIILAHYRRSCVFVAYIHGMSVIPGKFKISLAMCLSTG